MNVPETETICELVTVPRILLEMLSYCALEACEKNQIGYNCDQDEVTYYLRPSSIDTSIFDTLHGVEEIWIITKGGGES